MKTTGEVTEKVQCYGEKKIVAYNFSWATSEISSMVKQSSTYDGVPVH